MNKRNMMMFLFIVLIICVGFVLYFSPWQKEPFATLSADDIESIEIYIVPPNKSVTIENRDRIIEIVNALKEVKVYNKDIMAGQRAGQLVQYTVNMTSGETLQVGIYTPAIYINGQSFKAKYEPCERLNSLGNRYIAD